MKLLLLLGFIGVAMSGDPGIGGGVHYGGLYGGHFQDGYVGGGLDQNLHGVVADGIHSHEGYRGASFLGPALDVPGAAGVHHALHQHIEPHEGYAHGNYRRPLPYNAWRPVIKKPIVPVVKKVVAKRPLIVGPPVIYKPTLAAGPLLKSIGHGHGHHHHEPTLKKVEVPIYKPVYKHTPISVTPSLSYGYSYKLVPTYSYGPAVVNDHGFHGIGLNHGLGHGLNHGLGHGLSHGLGHGLNHGLGHGLNHGLGHGLSHGLGHGLNHGLGHGLNHGLGHELNHGYGHGFNYGHGHSLGYSREIGYGHEH